MRSRQLLDHRHDAPQLLLGRDHLRAPRPGGLASDVDDARAVPEQRFRVGQRRLGISEAAAVAEAVGSDVENADDDRPIERDRASRGAPDEARVGRHGQPDLERDLHQPLRRGPRPGEARSGGIGFRRGWPSLAR